MTPPTPVSAIHLMTSRKIIGRRHATIRRRPVNRSRNEPVGLPKRRPRATAELRCEQVGHYRLYCLDKAGKVASADWVEADDDQAAIGVAKEKQDGHSLELWQRDRLVARLDMRGEV